MSNYYKDKYTFRTLSKLIQKDSLFADITRRETENVVKRMYSIHLKKHDYVIKSGQMSSAYYIIQSGEMALWTDDCPHKSKNRHKNKNNKHQYENSNSSFDTQFSQLERTDKNVNGFESGIEESEIDWNNIATRNRGVTRREARRLYQYDSFGEESLLFNSKRECVSVQAVTDCTLWALNKNDFTATRMAISDRKLARANEKVNFLSRVDYFRTLDTDCIKWIGDRLQVIKYNKGDYIFRENEPSFHFFIVLKGACAAEALPGQPFFKSPRKKQQQKHKQKEKHRNGNTSNNGGTRNYAKGLTISTSNATSTATSATNSTSLTTPALRHSNQVSMDTPLIGSPKWLENVQGTPISANGSNSVSHTYSSATNNKTPKLVLRNTVSEIVREMGLGTSDRDLDTIGGPLSLTSKSKRKSQKIQTPRFSRKYNEGEYFGEFGIIHNVTRGNNIVAITDECKCYVMRANDFRRILARIESIANDSIKNGTYISPRTGRTGHSGRNGNGSTKSIISCNGKRSKRSSGKNNNKHNSKSRSREVKTKLSEFKTIGVLGIGTFGKVSLIEDPRNGKTYSLKKIVKNKVIEYKQETHMVNERTILSNINSKFCVKFYRSYQDDLNVYFLMEAVLGGELFYLLQWNKNFNENTSRFYAACVVCAFEYLHSKNIIFRDLKPENVCKNHSSSLFFGFIFV